MVKNTPIGMSNITRARAQELAPIFEQLQERLALGQVLPGDWALLREAVAGYVEFLRGRAKTGRGLAEPELGRPLTNAERSARRRAKAKTKDKPERGNNADDSHSCK